MAWPFTGTSAGHRAGGFRKIGGHDQRCATGLEIWIAALAWLLFITGLAASGSFNGTVPIDARTFQNLDGTAVHFEFSYFAVAIEPFSAVAAIVAGAPDYRMAAVATFCWLAALGAITHYWLSRRQVEKPAYLRIVISCRVAFAASTVLALYFCFTLLVPLPTRSLIATDPTTVVADLHSHTLLSYDGIASCEENLSYHRSRGYGVVAITDHFSDPWPLTKGCFSTANTGIPETIYGVEIFGLELECYLLVLGIQPDALPEQLLQYDESRFAAERVERLIETVHRAGGAVVALSFHLHRHDIQRLLDAGIDGFEIANFGHPDLPDDMKAALLQAQLSHRVALVADSDWHGWGGFAQTWTLIKPAGSTRPIPRSGQVIDVLRARDSDRVTPVIFHEMGRQSLTRGIFAPFVETFRYARELTPLRLASWWCWTFLVAVLALYLKRRGYSPVSCIVGLALLVFAAGLLFRGGELIAVSSPSSPFPFALQVGATACGAGAVALLLACALLARPLTLLRSRIGHRNSTE